MSDAGDRYFRMPDIAAPPTAKYHIVDRFSGVTRYSAPTANARDWFLALVKDPDRFVVLHGWRAVRAWRRAHAEVMRWNVWHVNERGVK